MGSSNNLNQYHAIRGLFRANREAALAFATGLADGKIQGASVMLALGAAEGLAANGSIEEIRSFLDPARTPQPKDTFLERLILFTFGQGPRTELLPDLQRFC